MTPARKWAVLAGRRGQGGIAIIRQGKFRSDHSTPLAAASGVRSEIGTAVFDESEPTAGAFHEIYGRRQASKVSRRIIQRGNVRLLDPSEFSRDEAVASRRVKPNAR